MLSSNLVALRIAMTLTHVEAIDAALRLQNKNEGQTIGLWIVSSMNKQRPATIRSYRYPEYPGGKVALVDIPIYVSLNLL